MMSPLLLELSSLEVEPLSVVMNPSEPVRSLDALTTTKGEIDLHVVLTVRGTIPVNEECACQTCCCGYCE
jgi:hypothetical protein